MRARGMSPTGFGIVSRRRVPPRCTAFASRWIGSRNCEHSLPNEVCSQRRSYGLGCSPILTPPETLTSTPSDGSGRSEQLRSICRDCSTNAPVGRLPTHHDRLFSGGVRGIRLRGIVVL